MTKFKAGDKFIPHRPKDKPYPLLDGYWEFIFTVKTVENVWVTCNEHTLMYHVDWCEKVEEHIPEASKPIDWEQRRYEIAKDFMTAQINGLYLKNKGWSYDYEARYAVDAADVLIKQLQKSLEK